MAIIIELDLRNEAVRSVSCSGMDDSVSLETKKGNKVTLSFEQAKMMKELIK